MSSDDYGATAAIARELPARLLPSASALRRATSSRPTRTCSITCGASGGCRATSIRSTRSSRIRWSARGLLRVFGQGLDRVASATCCRSRARPTARGWRSGALVPARRALLPDSRRFAAGLSAAAGFAAVGLGRATIRTCCRRIRCRSRVHCRCRRRRSSRLPRSALQRRAPQPRGSRPGKPQESASWITRTALAPSRARACSTSSCRRRKPRGLPANSWPPSKTPRARSSSR